LGGPDCLSSHVMIKTLAEAVKRLLEKGFARKGRLPIANRSPHFTVTFKCSTPNPLQ
jgi:hypothetical protein